MSKKKKVIVIILVIIVVLILLRLGFYIIGSKRYLAVGEKYYDISLRNYLGDAYQYELSDNGNYKIYLFNDGQEFYRVTNISVILKDYTQANQKNFLTDNYVIKEGENYYVPADGYISSLHYVTYKMKFVSFKKNKIKFKIISYFCGEEDPEESSCESRNYITTTSYFSLEKGRDGYSISSFIFPKNPATED